MDRAAVLVTGMSGTGKSTALEQLGRRGHRDQRTTDVVGVVAALERVATQLRYGQRA